MVTIALSHLLERGVRLDAHEAVAIARELLEHPGGSATLEHIQLSSDGSAVSVGSAGAASVADVAQLLLTLLPSGTPNVPPALRYAVARGLQAVEAPPFASLREFSTALERFEAGSSREVVKSILQRAARPRPAIAAPAPVAPPAATLPDAGPAPLAPEPRVPSPRPTLVVSRPAAPSYEPRLPLGDHRVALRELAATQPVTASSQAAAEADAPARPRRRWALVAAVALVASFAVGFIVGDGLTDRGVATQSAGSTNAAPDVETPAASSPRQDSPAANAVPVDAPRLEERAGDPIQAVRALRAGTVNAFSPAFASDGRAIFFHTGRPRDARSAIEVSTDAGDTGGASGTTTLVDDGSHNYHAQPSPDGRFVAFDSDRDGERGIYVANRDGSQVRRVSGPGYAAVPTWSRNSQQLAYIRREPDRPSVWNLWIQPAAGGSARRVTSYRYGQTWAASWFPDDRRIAYSHEDSLVVMDLQTGGSTRYRSPVKGQLVRTPAVSPDGTTVIFQVFRHGAWVLDLASGSMTRVLSDPSAEEFAWSPDGRRVAFHTRRDGRWGIYVLSRS